jgi:vacuolar iron transporter family protein
MAHDALGAHARDELGITPTLEARPIQAALASAASFMFGAGMPLIVMALVPPSSLLTAVPATLLLALACLGAVAARTGGAKMLPGAIRSPFEVR